MTDAIEPIHEEVLGEMRFLVNSWTRIRILVALTDGARTESELTDCLDEPQATIHQNLRKLTDRDLVTSSDGGYRATWRGEVLSQVVAEYGRRVAAVGDLEPFLAHVPVSAIDVSLFENARVTETRPNRPEATIERTIELFEGARDIRLVTPYIVPRFIELIHGHVVDGGNAFELVTTTCAMDALIADHAEDIRSALETCRASLFAYEGSIPYAVIFVDDRLLLGAFDETGIPRALVETTESDALAWGEERYREYRSAAAPLTLADISEQRDALG